MTNNSQDTGHRSIPSPLIIHRSRPQSHWTLEVDPEWTARHCNGGVVNGMLWTEHALTRHWSGVGGGVEG